MSAKKTSAKATKAKASVKAPAARKTAAKKSAKTVVAAAKPKLSKAQGDAIAAKLKPASKARVAADAKRSVKRAVKTTLAMQTANAPFIKGVDEVPKHLVGTQPRVIEAVGRGKRVVPPKSAATDTSMDPALHASKPMPQLQEGKPDERSKATQDIQEVLQDIAEVKAAFPTQQMDVPKYTMARSYMRKGAPGEGQLRRGTYQCTVAFTPEQMQQVRAAAVFRAVSLAELIRSFVVAHLNANAGSA